MTNADETPETAEPPGEPVTGATPEEALEAPAEGFVAEPVETRSRVEVGLVRSVRYGRVIVVFAALGAVVAGVAALFFPVAEDADYELGQVVGLMVVVGGAIGLSVGAILSLLLGLVARRKRGEALAVHTDVG